MSRPFRLQMLVPSESDIQCDALRVLRKRFPEPGAWVERNNTGATRTPAGRFLRFGLGVGGPDIVLVTHGLLIAIEFKKFGEKLRPEQEAWRARHESAGGVYIVAHSAREAIDGVNAALAGRRVAA